MEFATLAKWHAVPTLVLCGVIWIVQVVHYPLYARVGTLEFPGYERDHCARIGFLVMPWMLVEAVLASWLAWSAPPAQQAYALAGLALLVVVWGSTFLVQVPCHRRLELGFDRATWLWLVRSNWVRPVAWSRRGGLATMLIA